MRALAGAEEIDEASWSKIHLCKIHLVTSDVYLGRGTYVIVMGRVCPHEMTVFNVSKLIDKLKSSRPGRVHTTPIYDSKK